MLLRNDLTGAGLVAVGIMAVWLGLLVLLESDELAEATAASTRRHSSPTLSRGKSKRWALEQK